MLALNWEVVLALYILFVVDCGLVDSAVLRVRPFGLVGKGYRVSLFGRKRRDIFFTVPSYLGALFVVFSSSGKGVEG